ncbi:MAG: redoxin domain-containing protein [Pirellulaceae bacterium]
MSLSQLAMNIRLGVGAVVLAATTIVGATSVHATDPVAVGSEAPDFNALTPDQDKVNLATYAEAKVVVLVFTGNSCPVAQAYEPRFIQFVKDYEEKGVKLVAINCNSNENVESLQRRIADIGINYDYVSDTTGRAARDYGASVTPQIFVLDGDRKVAFTGPFDDDMAKPGVNYVRDAVNALLDGREPAVTSARPFGCRIKLAR